MSYREDVKLMKALADENRLAILEMLQQEEKCACVILEELHITQPTLSHHMKILCESGIVDSCKDGKWMHYSISFEGSKKLKTLIDKYTIDDCQIDGYRKCHFCKE
ncbi:MAG: ArsR/SmtB family transcription factor [Anaerovoracaceae bacterium]|jgi:ArsR family transcriptional regulator